MMNFLLQEQLTEAYECRFISCEPVKTVCVGWLSVCQMVGCEQFVSDGWLWREFDKQTRPDR